jgi:hypothetical protein
MLATNIYGSSFIENKGQIINQYGEFRNDVKFIHLDGIFKVILKDNSFSYEVCSISKKNANQHKDIKIDLYVGMYEYHTNYHRIDIDLIDANPNPKILKEGKSNDYTNYYLSYLPKDEILNVHCYDKIIYKDIYPNIDLIFYSNKIEKSSLLHKTVKYDFIVHPGADYRQIKMKIKGSEKITKLADRSISIKTSLGQIIENIPLTYVVDGNSLINAKFLTLNNIESNYIIKDSEVSFNISTYDESKTLVIDPDIIWGTYFGSSYQEWAYGTSTDSEGNTLIAGTSYGPSSVIATSGAHQTQFAGAEDGIIAKFDNDGNRLWGTYYGGGSTDCFYALATDNLNNNDIALAGNTSSSSGIATSGTHQPSNVGSDAYIVVLDKNGVRKWGTYYGGNGQDFIFGITFDSHSNVIACGATPSTNNIASAGAHQTTFGGGVYDAFLCKFDTNGTRLFGTYLGSTGKDGSNEQRFRVKTDKDDNIYFGGYTSSTSGIATSGSDKSSKTGYSDGYLQKFNPYGSRVWGTYIGGDADDRTTGLTIVEDGIIITGITNSNNGIAKLSNTSFKGQQDAFVCKYSFNGEKIWGHYYGGSNDDLGIDLTTRSDGNIVLLGWTNSNNNISINENNATSLAGDYDTFIALLNSTGETIYSSYFGGSSSDNAFNVYCDNQDNIIFGGHTRSNNRIATNDAFQKTNAGNQDGFIMKINYNDCDYRSFIYKNFHDTNKLNLISNAKKENDTITLTPSVNWRGGAVWHDNKIPIQNGFTTEFAFRFSEGSNKYHFEEYPGADGIAFVIQNYSDKIIGTFGSGIGYETIPNSFAVEYDTYKNFDVAFQSTVNDPNENHIAVFCNGFAPNSANHKSSAHITTNDTIMPMINDGRIFYSKIEYNIEPNIMKIWLDSVPEFPNPPVIILDNIDLSQLLNLTCDEFAWLGFTSSTGLAFEKHELLNWKICATPSSSIIPKPKITSGSDTICEFEICEYICNIDNNVNYEWIVVNGTIISGQGTNKIIIQWNSYGVGLLKLCQKFKSNNCSDTVRMEIYIMPLPKPDITGMKESCLNDILSYNCIKPANTKNKWEITDAKIIGSSTDDEVKIEFNKIGEAKLKLIQENTITACKDSTEIKVKVFDIPKPKIIKTVSPVLSNQETEYTSNFDMDVLIIWIVEGGDIINGQGLEIIKVKWRDTTQGKISLIHYNTKTGCSDTVSQIIDIILNPNLAILGSKDVCVDEISGFSTSNNKDYNYKWQLEFGEIIGDSTSNNMKAVWHKSGKDYLKMIYKHKTYNLSDSIIMEINIHDLPIIVFDKLPDVCLNDEPLILNFATPAGGNYSGTGVVSNMFYSIESGVGSQEITYTYTDPSYGCKNSASSTITVLEIPEKPVISLGGKTLISSLGFKYEWYKDGNLVEGETGQYHTPTASGYFTVIVIGENGCKSDMSEPFYFDITDVKDSDYSDNIKIYPNPANDEIVIEFAENIAFSSIIVFDILGRNMNCKLTQISLNNFKIKTNDFESGIYFINIVDSGNIIRKSFAIIR